MKNSLLLLSLLITLVSAPVLSAQTAAGTNATSATAPSDNGQRAEKMRAALEQLDLTDAQKQQIKQIRATTQPGKERRQQIMAVLTPDQKQKLIAMLKDYRTQQAAQ
jgi:Spy/CpxP family protein refolding chaperone